MSDDDWHKTLPPDEVRKRGGSVYFSKVRGGGISRLSCNYKARIKVNEPTEDGMIRRLTIEEAKNDPEP